MTDYIRITPEGHIRVTSASPFDYIVSYVPFPDINKMVGDPIALPNTATVTRKSGKVETLIVKWEPTSTDFAGTFDISGSVGNGAGVVIQRVIVAQLTDLDILRQIRDANPNSQLPILWSEDKDPYTEWWDFSGVEGLDYKKGVLFGASPDLYTTAAGEGIVLPNTIDPHRAYILDLSNDVITGLDAKYLTELCALDCSSNRLTDINLSGSTELQGLWCFSNLLASLDISGQISLKSLYCNNNRLISIPSLNSKGLITQADFTHNLMPQAETNRLINVVGFTPAQVLPQDI